MDLFNFDKNSSDWPSSCPSGQRQSPININRRKAIRSYLPPLKLANYRVFYKGKLFNTGHCLQLKLFNKKFAPYITGAGLIGKYILDNIHFHWESEHTIDHDKFPLEGHFVHYNSKYSGVKEAATDPKGIAVLSVLYKYCQTGLSVFDDLAVHIPNISKNPKKGTSLNFQLRPMQLLPSNLSNFYKYSGSLTTPNFDEATIWIICQIPAHISQKQLNYLTKIYDEDGSLMRENCRAVQPLHGRKVYVRQTY